MFTGWFDYVSGFCFQISDFLLFYLAFSRKGTPSYAYLREIYTDINISCVMEVKICFINTPSLMTLFVYITDIIIGNW